MYNGGGRRGRGVLGNRSGHRGRLLGSGRLRGLNRRLRLGLRLPMCLVFLPNRGRGCGRRLLHSSRFHLAVGLDRRFLSTACLGRRAVLAIVGGLCHITQLDAEPGVVQGSRQGLVLGSANVVAGLLRPFGGGEAAGRGVVLLDRKSVV